MPVSGALTDGRARSPCRGPRPWRAAAGASAARRGRRRRGPARCDRGERLGLAQDQRGPAGPDLELGQVAAIEEHRQPVDERRAGERRRRRSRRRPARAAGGGGPGRRPASASGVASSVIASNRRKMSAVFWPPNPNELLSAVRTSGGLRDVRRQVEPAPAGSGSSRLIVGGTQPSRIVRIVTIASIAPAAPSVCPSIDLLAVIATSPRGRRRSS